VDRTSLSRRTVDAFAWRMLSESSKLALQLGVQIGLARLLRPEAFGLLAIASLVINFGSRVSEIGTGPALIQRVTITPVHVRVAFTVSLLCGGLVSVLIWMGAPLVAAIFKIDGVTPVLRLIGLVFFIGSIGTTAEALLLRAMDYRRLLRVELVSYAFGYALVGITLAALQFGVWALAWATVAQAMVKTTMVLAASPHPARPSLSRTELRQILNFGVGMTLGRLASFAAQSADTFVVARWLGAAALGFYSRAYTIMCIPFYLFSSVLNSVLFSAYSSVQTDSEKLRRGYLTSVSLSSLVVFPVLTTLGVVAPELIAGVFGPRWTPAVVPLQILCVAGAWYCIHNLADSLIRAKGAVYLKSVYHGVYALSVLGGTIVGSKWGIGGVAVGVTVATVVVYFLMADLSLRLTSSSWWPFFRAQLPAVAVSGAVAVIGEPFAMLLRSGALHPLVVLGATGIVCSSVAIAATIGLPRRWLAEDLHGIVAEARRYGFEAAATLWRTHQPGTA